MKKILSLLLTILLLLSSMLFVPACTDRDSAQDGTQSTTLVRAIQELTGVSLYRIDDEEAAKTSGNYILLGTTCFDESAAVIESINGERHGSIYL